MQQPWRMRSAPFTPIESSAAGLPPPRGSWWKPTPTTKNAWTGSRRSISTCWARPMRASRRRTEMCGINGRYNFDSRPVAAAEIVAMRDTMPHRGPDDAGLLIDGCVGLGHRRLSIIDLSGGHQPIANEDGAISVVLNGEIYNFNELRAGLIQRGHQFRTRSDTEVIVHLYEEHGVECLQR